VSPLVGGVELRDSDTLLATPAGRTAVVALCKPQDREFVLAAAHAALATARANGVPVDPVILRERAANENEWRDVWKQFFRATRIGRRFLVRPSWDPGEPADGEIVIDLDPGRAFGTGAHPSTQLVLGLAEDLRDERPHLARFLDLGCGSGILAVGAAALWPTVNGLAIDNDPEATACSKENLTRNRVRSVTIATGTLADADGVFDLIMANIQADVLCALAPALTAKVAIAGHALLSGILLDQADEVAAAYAAAGLALVRRRDEGEWVGLHLRHARAAG
jgi:ribosomal protein L11 methyltransferase